MDSKTEFSREELEKALERAQREMQAALEKMTPEERARAEAAAAKLAEEDRIRMQKLVEDASAIASGAKTDATKKPSVCPNCGAPCEGGNFCSYCGSKL